MIEFVDLHVPKCGGTTKRMMLTMLLGGADKVHIVSPDLRAVPFYDRQLGDHPDDFPRWEEDVQLRPAEAPPPGARLLTGHFPADRYRAEHPGAKWFVFLRNPITRLLSLYYSEPQVEGMPFMDFCRNAVMRNQMARIWLRGMALGQFDFVGLFEHFAQDVERLVRALGLDPIDQWALAGLRRGQPMGFSPMGNVMPVYRPTQDPRYHGVALTKAEVSELTELNAADMALYCEAVELRNARG